MNDIGFTSSLFQLCFPFKIVEFINSNQLKNQKMHNQITNLANLICNSKFPTTLIPVYLKPFYLLKFVS